jgi:hypothetical protein
MTLTTLQRGLVLTMLFLLTGAVPALASVTWDLTGVSGSDGASYSGSFVFNADTDIYSMIDIVSTGGTLTPADTYTFQASSYSGSGGLVALAAPPSDGDWLLNLLFAGTGLTDAGGTVALISEPQVAVGTCTAFLPPCVSFDAVSTITGSVAGAAIPEPATLVLVGPALLLAVFRKKLVAVF